MTQPRLGERWLAYHNAVRAVLAIAILVTGFTGRAGVAVVSASTAARFFALHTHGLIAEREYVSEYRAPAPYVHPHCHNAPYAPDQQPSPGEVQAASSLAAAAQCAVWTAEPTPLIAFIRLSSDPSHALVGRALPPLPPPPQV
ncbi:MAG: hypothetical protein U0531_09260 [Dehalococcoidia bacterium]